MRTVIAGVRQARRLVPDRWWARAPFLPVPDRSYVRFRALTQYGDARRRPSRSDVRSYLRWCAMWQDLNR